jgi:hypothetical protein
MYEITIKGITKQFKSAKEMAEWQESMTVVPKRKYIKRKEPKKAPESSPLRKFLK